MLDLCFFQIYKFSSDSNMDIYIKYASKLNLTIVEIIDFDINNQYTINKLHDKIINEKTR